MEFDKVVRERSATRKFSNQNIELDNINKILEAGRLAPTAKNLQPIKIYLINSKEGLEKIDKASPCRYNAPVVFIICGDKNVAFSKNNHSTYEIDASIVATHMMLKATDINIDNIWIEMFDENVLKEEFLIPDNLIPVCLLSLGYKAIDCPISINHNIRKNLDELVIYK